MTKFEKFFEALYEFLRAWFAGNNEPTPSPGPAPGPAPVPTPGPTPGRTLIWSDEFMGSMSDRWHFYIPQDGGKHRDAINDRNHAKVINNKLVMTAEPMGQDRPRTSYLRSWDDKNMGNNPLLIDPTKGDIYIETSIKLDKAWGSQGAWWAFWLFSPDNWDEQRGKKWDGRLPRMEPYDGNANTGMEVDILEYCPHLPTGPGSSGRRNGFNCAAYIDLKGGALHPTTPDGHGFYYDINDYISGPKINLLDGNFHKLGFRQTPSKYEFFIDGQKYWEITDPRFITRSASNAMIMSWEIENGLWGETGPTFSQVGKTLEVQVDYVRVYREN